MKHTIGSGVFRRTHAWEMKAAYQKNHLSALSIVMLIAVCVGLYLTTLTSHAGGSPSHRYSVREINLRSVGGGNTPRPETAPTFEVLKDRPAPTITSFPRGLIGPNLQIVSEAGAITIADCPARHNFELVSTDDYMLVPGLGEKHDGDIPGWTYETDPDPFALGATLLNERVFPAGLPTANNSNTEYVVTDTGVFILPPILFPLEAKETDTGLIILDILVDQRGDLEWSFILVTPENKGFRRVVEQALLQGTYSPAAINHRKVARRFTTSIIMILGQESQVLSKVNLEDFRAGFAATQRED